MMVDTYKYDENYYVHYTHEDWRDGEAYGDVDNAIEGAKDDALGDASDRIITHVLIREVKRVSVRVEVIDV